MVDVARPAASSSSLEDTLRGLKPEEIDQFQTKFKDPKFMELFAEYARDLADPKNRAESEQYLRQLEQEGRSQEMYGQGTQLVAPDPSFVAKTANKQSGQKIFINVCTSDKVEVATSKRIPNLEGSAKRGMHWQIPTILGRCKEGSDRDKIQCWVVDFVIHPDTCRMAMNNARFKSMVMDTATDLIEKQQGWTLTRQYTFPKLIFKATEGADRPQVLSLQRDRARSSSAATPSSQPVAADSTTASSSADDSQSASKASGFGFKFPLSKSKIQAVETSSQENQSQASHRAGSGGHNRTGPSDRQKPAVTTASNSKVDASSSVRNGAGRDELMTAVTAARNNSKPDAGSRSGNGASAGDLMTPVATTRMEAIALGTTSPASPGPSAGRQCVEPEHELVYRGQVDLGDAWEGPGSKSVPTRHPKELLIRVKLPGLRQASQAQLNVQARHLTVSVPSKYHLRLKLPYDVAVAEGKASFNAVKQQLEVVLPVVPAQTNGPAPDMLPAEAQAQQQQSDDQSDMGRSSSNDADTQQSSAHSTLSSSALSHSSPTRTVTSSTDRTETSQARLAEQHQQQQADVTAGSDVQQQSRQVPELTANQRKWQELHQPAASTPAVANSTTRSQPAPSIAADAQAADECIDTDALQQAAASGKEFVPCPRFVQHLTGYVYTRRDTGLGYYKDTRNLQPEMSLQTSSDCDHGAVQAAKQPAVKYLLKPRLVSLADADELD